MNTMNISRKDKIIQELIITRINGNSIKGNETYEKMIKRVSFQDILGYIKDYEYNWEMTDIGRSQKLDLINSIVKNLKRG